MTNTFFAKLILEAALFAGALAMPLAGRALAQETPATALELAAGALLFPDDGTVTEGMVGGSGRYYVLPRLAIGPEIAYVSGSNHSHLMVTGNVTFDFVRPVSGRPPRITPFLLAGGGLFHTRDQTPRGGFNSNEGAFTAGGGVRGFVSDRVFIGAEARIGWELHLRFNGFVGWRY
jgi:hypothetical protein